MKVGHTIQELLTVVLMAVSFFAIFYLDIGIPYKIFMAILVLAIVFLVGLVDVAVKQMENRQF